MFMCSIYNVAHSVFGNVVLDDKMHSFHFLISLLPSCPPTLLLSHTPSTIPRRENGTNGIHVKGDSGEFTGESLR